MIPPGLNFSQHKTTQTITEIVFRSTYVFYQREEAGDWIDLFVLLFLYHVPITGDKDG